ncbi:hypothetical protein [Mycoplasma sp. 2575]
MRGSVDVCDFKQYILVTLFYRYTSENITKYFNDNWWKRFDKETFFIFL